MRVDLSIPPEILPAVNTRSSQSSDNFETLLQAYRSGASADRFDMTGVLGHQRPVPEKAPDALKHDAYAKTDEDQYLKTGPTSDLQQEANQKRGYMPSQRSGTKMQAVKTARQPSNTRHVPSVSSNFAKSNPPVRVISTEAKNNFRTSLFSSNQDAARRSPATAGQTIGLQNFRNNMNPIFVALFSTEEGLKIHARISEAHVQDSERLAERMKKLLTEHGFTRAEIILSYPEPLRQGGDKT